jgi:hypothetical protein
MRQNMRDLLGSHARGEALLGVVDAWEAMLEPDEFEDGERLWGEVEVAVYWIAVHWHGGQWSELYALQCASPYSPGMGEDGPEEESAASDIYAEMNAILEVSSDE